MKAAISEMLDAEDQPPSEISVLFVDAEDMLSLNERHRGIRSPTDVLSFPIAASPDTPGRKILGDVVVCIDVAAEQASARKATLESEVAHLAVHGTLHLLGYEDDSETGRLEMVRKMNLAVQRAGLESKEDWASLPH